MTKRVRYLNAADSADQWEAMAEAEAEAEAEISPTSSAADQPMTSLQTYLVAARVPAGVNDGAKIRVKGKGALGEAGPGDLFISLHVKAHPIFSRKADNILLTLPVTFVEATLGADIKVPTLDGDEVTVRLAPGTPNGRTLRVKGRGIKKGSTTGDLLATIEVQVPQKIEIEASEALKKFADATSTHDVRMEFRAKASQ